jgi:glutamate dehydrogenase (NADP+)
MRIMSTSTLNQFLESVQQRDPNQNEYLQAVREVLESLWPFIERNPRYASNALLERLVEPERVIQFRVSWMDDKCQVRVNRAFRIQHNNAIGPYKGGMRFHPSVNLVDPEIPGLRANVQKCAHHSAHGWRQGWFGLRSQR